MKISKTQNKIIMIGSGVLLGTAIFGLIHGSVKDPFFPISVVGVCAVAFYIFRNKTKPN